MARGHTHLGQNYVGLGEFDKGIFELEMALKIVDNSWNKALLGYAYALNGELAKASGLLAELETASKTTFVPVALLGVLNFALGDKEEAFSLIKKAVDEKSGVIPYLRVFPIFKDVRADPRFMNLLEKMFSG